MAAAEHANGACSDLPVSKSDVVRFVLQNYFKKFNTQWRDSGCWLAGLKNDRSFQVPPPFLSRIEKTILARLRIDHTRLTHDYLMNRGQDPPRCQYCNEILNLSHLILCRSSVVQNALRNSNLLHTEDNLLDYNGKHLKGVLTFLKTLKIFNKI